MSLLTDDQKMLQETAASFLAEEGSIARQLRHWRDTDCFDVIRSSRTARTCPMQRSRR